VNGNHSGNGEQTEQGRIGGSEEGFGRRDLLRGSDQLQHQEAVDQE